MTTTTSGHDDPPAADTGIRIREAGIDDLDVVVELRLALLREYEGRIVFDRVHPDAEARAPELCARQLASLRDAFFLAETAGAIVGMLRVTMSQSSPLLLPPRFAYLSSAYVRPAFRRRGVIRALLGHAEAWSAARGLLELRLHNVPGGDAAATWKALGFGVAEEVRTRRVEVG